MLRKKYLIPCLWMICFLAALCPEGKGLPEETLIGQLSMRLIEENDVLTGYRDVVGAFRKEAKRYEAPCLLKAMEQILSDPFSLEPVTLSISEELAQHAVKGGRKDLKGLFAAAAGVIDCSVGEVEVPAFEGGGSVEDHLAHIEKVLDAAAALRANALTNLNEEEKQLAYVTLASVLDKFIDGVYLETGADEATLSNYNRGLEVLSKIDCGAMAEAALVLSSLASPDYVKRVEKHFKKLKVKAPAEAKDAGFTGDVLAFRDTPHGPVVIGGKKTTKYKAQAAFILDLGGADTYNAAASTLDLERGISMVVDLDGKDKYLVKDAMNLVACRLGVSLLFDLKGNDVYEGTRGTQGLGAGGVALLWDEEGKDRYKAGEYAQGGAFFGLGLLVDRKGKDVYDAHLHAQGFGLTKGFGLLVDVDDDDVYTATGKYPSTYGTKGVYHAASQGHGTGLRRYENEKAPLYAGGIGLLLDADGDDQYEAGNFSQGCGYFFGCGMLVDKDGDDVLKGSRYTQGTGAHQAAGIVVNEKGDDEYDAIIAANQAGTWDMTAGMLLDYEGNDEYKAQGLAQAGTAQTAFALLFDGAGKDKYSSRGIDCQGGTGSFEYHNKPSLSILLDLGGGKDSYSRPDRKDNIILVENWFSIFADFKAKSLESVLKSSPRKLKGEWGTREK